MGDARAHGAFPRMLRRFARKAPQPYRTAFKMAAEEIEELREAVSSISSEAESYTHCSWDRDCTVFDQEK